MSKITKFEDLQCWQDARILANHILDICESPELSRSYKLRDQLQSAGISVMNNIAEGFGRFGQKDFIRFLNIASSSCCEVKSMSYLLSDRKILNHEQLLNLQTLINTTYNRVLGMIKYLNTKYEIK